VKSIQQVTLPSGIRLVTERMPDALSVSSGVWVGVGARDEAREMSGVSHFLEHLLFKGTADRSAKSIAEAIDRVGGDMNAFTSKEVTAYYTRLPARHWALGLEILGSVVSSPALRDADVETEREVILEELGMDEDALDDRALTLLAESLFPDHPLGWETAGDKDTVAAITPKDVRAFFKKWYRPANMVVSLAGAIDHDDAAAAVEKWFTSAPGGSKPKRVAPVGETRPLAVVRKKSEQAHIAIGYRAVDRDDPDREALDVASQVLGGGPSSRLFDEIREMRGLAYSVFASQVTYADAGALSVYVGTSPDHVGEVLHILDTELDKLATDGVTDHELEIAKGYLTGAFVLGLEDSASRMSRLAGHVSARGYVRSVDDQVARLDAVTGDDVRRVAKRVLGGQQALAVVGPVTKKALARK
jgi:predicted Zn-dependent peptidase